MYSISRWTTNRMDLNCEKARK